MNPMEGLRSGAALYRRQGGAGGGAVETQPLVTKDPAFVLDAGSIAAIVLGSVLFIVLIILGMVVCRDGGGSRGRGRRARY